MRLTTAWPRGPVKLPRVALGDTQRVLLLSILIGVASGLLVVCFHMAIDVVRWWSVGLPGVGRPVTTVLSPAIGALAATLMVRYVFREAKGSGVILTKAAVQNADLREDWLDEARLSGTRLDGAQLGKPAAFWCPQVWAARLLAGGATHPFLSPGPVWLARIPQQFLGRRLRSGRLGDLLGHDWHRPLFVRAAEYESFPFSARIHPDAASLRGYVEAAFPGRPLAELRALATIVSQPAEFVQEFRCFIAEGQVTAASQYLPRQGDSNAPWQSHGSQDADTADARRFAHDVCDAMGQDQAPGYTLDVGRLADGHWAVVEANPAWSSDPYHGDPDGAVASVLASQRRCNEWAWRPDPLLSSLPG